MNKSPIKVLIVDDHPVVRDGLKLMLSVSPGLNCIAQAENGEQAVRQCGEHQPDVVLMDLIMPGMDGISAIRLIRQLYPRIQVVALTSFDDRELVQKALRAGAISYLLKNASIEVITDTIWDAAIGKPTIAPAAMHSLIEPASDQPEDELSPREMEILLLLSEGLKNAAIAKELYISEATVRFHVGNILRKLGAANRAQSVRIALERGLIK